ncbi:Arsenite-resistance protein 2 [Dictyocaulus viviparus]|uniref:Serrate RNA effector molecule homolog n=1 Tax=Dictyocaulus viviparus TaxID=29172 RepID=A0A0D8Y9H4_DICVI|nr:Arsenite-resistance protein 2 [Dictyocaulus viviparus]
MTMYDSEEDGDRRNRDKFPRERENRREDDRSESDNGEAKNDDFSGPILSFKKFLMTQDDDISDSAALTAYNEYNKNINEENFNVSLMHIKVRNETVFRFRHKYHPDESAAVREAHLADVKKRLEIFNDLKSRGCFNDLTLDLQHAREIIRLMDTLVVRLEGGSEEDVEALKHEKIEDDSLFDLGEKKSDEDIGVDEARGSESEANDEGREKRKKTLLHKTSSVFMRNVPATVKISDIEAICSRSPGFLRVALSEPHPERNFARRAWATYKRDVNIKEICWTLNQTKLNDSTELSVILNRDLTRRIRGISGVTCHQAVAQNDIKQAAKLVALMDKRLGLFCEGEPKEERDKDIFTGVDLVATSRNPLLRQVRPVLRECDEPSAEEEEMLGISRGVTSTTQSVTDEKVPFVSDASLLHALDLLILYLRMVHSIDFYGHIEYPNEDAMPNRCGMLHVRGVLPSQFGTADDGTKLVSTKFNTEFINGFNQRLESGLMQMSFVTPDEMEKMGKKDGDKEVEAFIQANTVELSQDKWLCPLSGKKFKGPDFIRKHLTSKHEEKLREVREEAVFYNNYLADPNRPVNVEVKATNPPPVREDDRRDDRYRDRSDRVDRGYVGSGDRSRRGYAGFGSGPPRDRGPRFTPESARPLTSYRDLDAFPID